MTVHIGDCDHCPRKQVRITYGWTTRADKHCDECDIARKRAKAKYPVFKETDAHKEKRAALAEIKTYLIETKGCICEECGALKTRFTIDLSHLLSQGSHPELSEEIENCVLHCGGLDKCHAKWENGPKEWKLSSVTFSKHRSYIQKHSTRL
jgi:hypothetical protein